MWRVGLQPAEPSNGVLHVVSCAAAVQEFTSCIYDTTSWLEHTVYETKAHSDRVGRV